MDPIEDLTTRIRASYKLVCAYEAQRQSSSDPKEQSRCENGIREQWTFIRGYLDENLAACRQLNRQLPEDIRQISTHFPELRAAEDVQQAYSELRRTVPQSSAALDRLGRVLQDIGQLHEHLNEWKEVHNLLQDCIIALILLKSELEAAYYSSGSWNRMHGLHLWEPCRTKLGSLESLTRNIKHISDVPFCRESGALRGPSWMIQIVVYRDHLDAVLKEDDISIMYEYSGELWDKCLDALYQADKNLRDKVGELCAFSKAILRSLEDGCNIG